jgi:Mg-chelatase subunit ChlI
MGSHSNLKVAGAIENLMGKMKKGEADVKGARKLERHERRRDKADDLYSDDASSAHTPRTDSRPSTQDSLMSRETDSRPQMGASGSAIEEAEFHPRAAIGEATSPSLRAQQIQFILQASCF